VVGLLQLRGGAPRDPEGAAGVIASLAYIRNPFRQICLNGGVLPVALATTPVGRSENSSRRPSARPSAKR
jgi:hypothetical protein